MSPARSIRWRANCCGERTPIVLVHDERAVRKTAALRSRWRCTVRSGSCQCGSSCTVITTVNARPEARAGESSHGLDTGRGSGYAAVSVANAVRGRGRCRRQRRTCRRRAPRCIPAVRRFRRATADRASTSRATVRRLAVPAIAPADARAAPSRPMCNPSDAMLPYAMAVPPLLSSTRRCARQRFHRRKTL